jgi:hypothetical protein
MSTATTLPQAAGQAFDNLAVRWNEGQLKSVLSAYWPQIRNLFPDSNVNARPISNWMTIISSLTDQMDFGRPPLTVLNLSAQVVYRLCWMANALNVQGLITNTEALNVLAAYNGTIGF